MCGWFRKLSNFISGCSLNFLGRPLCIWGLTTLSNRFQLHFIRRHCLTEMPISAMIKTSFSFAWNRILLRLRGNMEWENPCLWKWKAAAKNDDDDRFAVYNGREVGFWRRFSTVWKLFITAELRTWYVKAPSKLIGGIQSWFIGVFFNLESHNIYTMVVIYSLE